jgi:antagonist of KipI
MSIRIIKNGVLDTIQDGGRNHYGYLGINPGGAMDRVAMQVANILVGNDPSSALIEMHIPAAEILFEETAMAAFAGADISARVNGEEVPALHPFIIKKNATLSFGKRNKGSRIYLAVKGGWAIEPWLNSYSTNTKAATGGFNGKALQKGDIISFKQSYNADFVDDECVKIFPWFANTTDLYVKNTIRFIPGQAYGLLEDRSKQILKTKHCIISRESDRMGFRLQTDALHLQKSEELISTGVTYGTIQLLPEGQMIILMADHQTTGGYPVIGYVISADLPSLAQLQSGESFLLEETDLDFAETCLLQQQMNLQQLQNACNFRVNAER